MPPLHITEPFPLSTRLPPIAASPTLTHVPDTITNPHVQPSLASLLELVSSSLRVYQHGPNRHIFPFPLPSPPHAAPISQSFSDTLLLRLCLKLGTLLLILW
ncbi:hypothetical protein GBA52_013986 [Prunus armeniaca]|nr:hypothetical protein GBA52_013986 [Prunus armeniaca]